MHKDIVIICDGAFPRKEYPRYLIQSADFIICCDGSVRSFLRNSRSIFGKDRGPDLIIGDMDSLSESLKKRFSKIIVKENEQEHNDMTKAFRWVMNNMESVERIHIIGATGKREDHTIGNLSLLMEYTRMFDLDRKGISVEAVSDYCTIFAVNDSLEMECGKGRGISIFSPDNSLRIKSEGLEWQTEEVIFDNWWKASLNRASEDLVRLEFSHRSLVLIVMN